MARRAQILDVTVQTLAAEGYANASLAKIAANTRVSKGVISYHFAGKDALMVAIIEGVYQGIAERVIPQLIGLDPLELVRAHVLAVARDVLDHPAEVTAIAEIATHMRGADGRPRFGTHTNEPLYQGLELGYEAGQASGAMWAFDRRVMAVLFQSALDSMFDYCRHHPERDVLAHAEALADLLVRAVAAPDRLPPVPDRAEPTPR